jgi:uncharacterized protein (DUF1015 family)
LNGIDEVAQLDVNVLTARLLGPVLSIGDLRRDRRIEFVGGAQDLSELERRVEDGMAAAFVLRSASIEDLMAVADRGDKMPPKSTWFDPKLADGLVSYLFD